MGKGLAKQILIAMKNAQETKKQMEIDVLKKDAHSAKVCKNPKILLEHH